MKTKIVICIFLIGVLRLASGAFISDKAPKDVKVNRPFSKIPERVENK